MTAERKRRPQSFELKAEPMPTLKPAAAPQPVEPEAADGAAQQSDNGLLDGLSPREVILRVVEAVKAL